MRLLSFLLLTLTALAGQPYSLTDGSFNGWEGDTKTTWRIEEGAFTAGSVEKNQPRNEFLCTKMEFGDFDLSVKWKLQGTEGFVNGGVQFRTKRHPNDNEVSGYQADLGAGYDGALYDESRRNRVLAQPAKEVLEKAKKPLGEWSTYRIRAEGPHIQIWLNGVQTVDYTETEKDIALTGIIAVQIHGNAKSQVWYKDIVIEELGKPVAVGPVQQRFADPLPAPPREPFKDGKFEIRTGEVIVFTGGTNMVRLIEQGLFEAALSTAWKEKPRFRNMAWDGDTVYEQWRDINFGSWKEQFDAVNATCVFLWFGQMEALDDSRDDAAFETACAKLLDEFKAVTPRLVVLGAPPFQTHDGSETPRHAANNARAAKLSGIMARLSVERGAIFVSLDSFDPQFTIPDGHPVGPETVNGVHYNDRGFEALAERLYRALYGGKWFEGIRTFRDGVLNKLAAIRAKNRLWHDCWKTMNWAFAYSDRTEQPFGKGIGEYPPMAKELEKYKPLLREADELIYVPERQPIPPAVVPRPPTQPQSPALEQQTFKVRDGFEVNLFASEADGLVKPLSMRWDERGRLWAACSPSYPQLVPGEPHGDYILVCEDTNGDGKADKFHKFVEGLTMPMGIEFAADGGVYVCESTQLALFHDTNNDGKADERTVILSGFGTGDSHQMINSLRWGPDGCLWFSQGLHIFSRIETPHGIVQFDRAGIWRFDPKTWKLQGFFGNAAAGANCWGVTFDDWGQVFHCAADNTPGFYTTPGLGTWPNPPPYYNIGALAVSPVKGMCLEYINSTHLPPDLQGVLCKPVYFANQLLLYKLVEDGSGYKTEDLGPLLTSSSNAFRPLGVQTGPDGALYICDWYNPVIGHYQASYRDPNRDKIHGRIWRVSAKDRPLVVRPELEKMDTAQLVDQLRSPERWVRDQARRLLSARDDSTQLTSEAALQPDATAALLYEILSVQTGRGSLSTALLRRCMNHEDARLRAFAVRLWSLNASGQDHSESPDEEEYFIKLLANAVNDPHPRVRLEAAIAASYFKSATALELACGVLDHPRDRFIDYALANTVRALKPYWIKPLEEGHLTFEGITAHLAFVLQTDGGQQMGPVLRKLLESDKVEEENRASLRALLIGAGGPDDLTYAASAGPMLRQILNALLAAARDRAVKPAGDMRPALEKWFAETAEEGQPLICRLAAAWGYPDIAAKLLPMTTVEDEGLAVNAVRAWAEVKGSESLPDLERLAQDQRRAIAAAASGQLLRFDAAKGAAAAAGHFAAAIGSDSVTSLLSDVLVVQAGPEQLAAAFTKQPPPAEMALTLLKALATAGRSDAALVSVLRKAAGLPENASVVPDYSAEFVTKLIADVKATGDAKRGEVIFHAAQAACIGCHKVGDTGGITGPDLTAIGRGMTPELLTESVLWPKRQIKEGFFLTTVTTHDGKILSGYKVNEDAKSLALRAPGATAADTVAKDKIKDRSDTGTLMPDNLTGWMSEEQRRDLLRYLYELGK